MSTRPSRPTGSSATAVRSSTNSHSNSNSTPTNKRTQSNNTPISQATHAQHQQTNTNKPTHTQSNYDADRDFTPMNIPNRPPSKLSTELSGAGNNGSLSGRRVAHATSTASAILKGSDSDDDDAGGEGVSRRTNFSAVLREAKLEAEAAAKEAAANGTAERSSTPPLPKETLAGGVDVDGPPALPAQPDEDNELFYVPRLSPEALERITGQSDLTKVNKLALHLNTEEQELSTLNTLLPKLQELHLIPPSFVSSFRDFGRSLVNIRKLVLPSAGLTDLDGIEFLTKLTDLRAPENRIEDLSPLMFATTLQVLDLSRNRIKERDMIEFIGVCVDLKELELEGNPISMCVHYRSIVASRCPDIPSFKLDGVLVTPVERDRRSEKDESTIDKPKLKQWQEAAERIEASAGSQAALQRKMNSADFNTLSTAPRPQHGTSSSATNSAASSKVNSPTNARAEKPISPTSLASSAGSASAAVAMRGPSASSSLSTSGSSMSSSAVSSAQRKKDYQAFLDSKESSMRGDIRHRENEKRKAEKTSAVMDIMRLENEMREDQANGVANEYVEKLAKQQQASRSSGGNVGPTSPKPSSGSSTTAAGIPRLQFDASFNAGSPNASPSPQAGGTFSSGFAGQNVSASFEKYSLSTPRPGSASGMRPGSASGSRNSAVAGQEDDSGSSLTYGSEAVMAGGYASAMRARKKQGSISISGGVDSKGSDESRSPSSTGRSIAQQQPTGRPASRSASPAPGGIRISQVQSTNPASAGSSKPVINAATAHQPILPATSGQGGLQPSRPLVVGSAQGSMLQRHISNEAKQSSTLLPVGSPLAAARAGREHDDVVFTIGAKKPNGTPIAANAPATSIQPTSTPQRPAAGKTYTLVRAGSNKK